MAGETITDPLISTKLHRPPVDRNHVHRSHLLERLDQRRRRPSTLVSAPAGYGKSFLISCWLELCDIPSAWLSLDENDNDLRKFTAYFIAAETAIFFKLALGTQVDSATAIALEEKTEGWVTGLRLAALSMRHRGYIDHKLLEPQTDTQYVLEYLFTEVFSEQPPETKQYLMGTAILDRFCGPLCEAGIQASKK